MQKITPHLWFDKEAGEARRLIVAPAPPLFQQSFTLPHLVCFVIFLL